MKTEALHTEQDTSLDLWTLIGEDVAILWKDWPKDMQLSSFDESKFVLNGECPHCGKHAAFMTKTSVHHENIHNMNDRMIGVLACVACHGYILGIVKLVYADGHGQWTYHLHYPIGKPDDKIAAEVPAAIAEDFSEALRCQWIRSYRACVVMCRRAIQTSAIELKAQGHSLVQQIDDLATKGIITAPLRDFAHEIRLTGNIGAHADSLQDVKEQDAAAIVEFTREYLDHVYILPERLRARKPSATAPKKP